MQEQTPDRPGTENVEEARATEPEHVPGADDGPFDETGPAESESSGRKMLPLIAALVAVVCFVAIGLLVVRPWDDADETTAPTPSATTEAGEPEQPSTEEIVAAPHKMFAPDNVFTQNITEAPVARNSAAMMRKMITEEIDPHYGGTVGLNAKQFYASFWVAGADTKPVTMRFDDCQDKGETPAGLYDGEKMFVDVPIPDNAVPATGTDQQLAIWSPSQDKLWEFWVTSEDAQGNWSACWGGRIDDVSQSPGYFSGAFGAAATGLAFVGSMVSVAEAQNLEINHAVGLNLINPANWDNFSYPAQRSDGYNTDPLAIPEGSRLRLDPTVNVDELDIGPLAKAIARAAQTYGFIVTDKAGSVAVIAEGGKRAAQGDGGTTDAWDEILGDTPVHEQLRGFPWDRVQIIEKDWGEPTA